MKWVKNWLKIKMKWVFIICLKTKMKWVKNWPKINIKLVINWLKNNDEMNKKNNLKLR